MPAELLVLPVDTADLGLVRTIALPGGRAIDADVQTLRLGFDARDLTGGLKLLTLILLRLG